MEKLVYALAGLVAILLALLGFRKKGKGAKQVEAREIAVKGEKDKLIDRVREGERRAIEAQAEADRRAAEADRERGRSDLAPGADKREALLGRVREYRGPEDRGIHAGRGGQPDQSDRRSEAGPPAGGNRPDGVQKPGKDGQHPGK